MKKLVCLLPVILLTGCFATAVPVKRNWPDVPTEITAVCPDLKKVSEEKVLTKNHTILIV